MGSTQCDSREQSDGQGAADETSGFVPGTYFLRREFNDEVRARVAGLSMDACVPQSLRGQVLPCGGSRRRSTADNLYFPEFVEAAVGGTITEAVALVEMAATRSGLSLTERCCGHIERTMYELADRMWARILVSEMRRRADKGELAGASPEERFGCFSTEVARRDAQTLLAEYRFMGARTVAKLLGVADFLTEILRAVEAAFVEVSSREPSASRCIDRLDIGRGDTHCGSRSVCTISFDTGLRVVYKPRGPELDIGYAAVVEPIMKDMGCEFTAPWVVRAGDGLIMSFLDADPPASDEEEADYCRSLGAQAALLYLLGGHDIHFENVIPRRRGPALIDVECLFRSTGVSPVTSATDVVWGVIDDSVLGTMLLPTVMRVGDTAVDVGAVGFQGDELSPVNSLVVKNAGRDDMEVRLERLPLTADGDVYGLGEMSLSPWSAMNAVVAGMDDALRTVLRSRSEMLERVAMQFAGARVRHLMAPTAGYGRVMRMLTHPSLASDVEEAARAMQRVGLFDHSDSIAVLTAEIFDLLNDDVPYFAMDVDSGDIFDSQGHRVRAGGGMAPLHAALARVRDLSDEGVREQVQLGRSAFAEKCGEPYATRAFCDLRSSPSGRRQRLTAIASAVADDLTARMIGGCGPRDVANWIDVRVGGDGRALWSPGAMDHNLYGGFIGVARFLTHAGTVLRREDYLVAASAVLEPFARQLGESPGTLDGLPMGDHVGVSGIVKTLVEYSRTASDGDWIRSVAVEQLSRRLDHQSDTGDVLSGAGGLLGACAYLASSCPEERDHLRATALETLAFTAALIGRGDGAAVLHHSGFAHGVAGLLSYIGPWVESQEGRDLAHLLGCALSSFYATDDGAFHTSRDKNGRAFGWCHGSPGILLACELFRHSAGCYPIAQDMVRRVATLSQQECLGRSFSYCHGDLGVADILLQCSMLSGSPVAPAADLLADAVERSWAMVGSETPSRGAFTRSLMVGTTGIGYGALRWLDPQAVPSILC